ncbi:MAG: type 4a pilus biogenesis protein PilO [Candidatus Omnitrophica bacterium]|nr:type 4a pilus biogenesis protein PilO [Candidatus Omnitrophota bacterium]
MPFDIMKNKQQLSMVMAAAYVAVITAYLLLVLKPQLVSIVTIAQKAARTGSELKTARSDIAAIEQMKTRKTAYRDKIELYEKRLPVEQEIPSVLETLSAMAKNANMRIVSITPVALPAPKGPQKKAEKEKIYQEIPISVSVKSGYHELGYFLSQLESSDRFMKVADISIRADKTSPRKNNVELLVLTYISLKGK